MIADMLPYIESYADVRSVTGLNLQELPDATIGLVVHSHRLWTALNGISGVYSPETTEQTLQEIFDRPLANTDLLYAQIQLFSMYTVADAILDSVGLKAYKVMADGKSHLGRFSPESTYLSVRSSIREALKKAIQDIYDLLEITTSEPEYLEVVVPDVDLVTGE